jgi:TAP42-like family protein
MEYNLHDFFFKFFPLMGDLIIEGLNFQETLRKACEMLEKCEDMISKLGLFSSNETKDDISTANLKYILVSLVFFSFFYLREYNQSNVADIVHND